MSDPVILTDYDPAWPQLFEAFAARAAAVLAPIPARIEHVGSTSVPGLPAKAIIDLDVVVAVKDVPGAIDRLGKLGYVPKGDGGLPGREAFHWPPEEARHHLYLCTPDTLAFREHILFRDYLRSHSETAREYGVLKRELAARYTGDRATYQAAKAAFIDAILRRLAG